MVKKKSCPHGKRKSHCKQCSGSQICIHNRRKQECTDCSRANCNVTINRNICRNCRGKHLSKRRRVLGLCAECHGGAAPRTEHVFGDMITEAVGFEPNLKDELVSVDHCVKRISCRRPDLVWIVPGKVAVVVEIDEDSHSNYLAKNEVKKILEQNLCIRALENCYGIPAVTIRVNPDSYDGGMVPQKHRAHFVGEVVKQMISGKITLKHENSILFAYYHSKSRHLVKEQSKHFNLLDSL